MHTINNLILFGETSAPTTFGEKLSTAAVTLLLGMLVVFSVLLIIMLVITLVGKIFQSVDKKKAAKNAVDTPASPEVVATPDEQIEQIPEEDDGALIAAITAAVSLCMEAEPGSFRVVSFKKTGSKTAWNRK